MYNVGSVGSLSSLSTSAGTVPAGGAMVTDAGSPAGTYMFSGPGTQSFSTAVKCEGGTSASGATTGSATLTASNGQQITQSATVHKQCYDLRVSVATGASPYVGRWGWAVRKTSSAASLTLKPEAVAGGGGGLFGRDAASSTTGDVVYSVTFTRSAPAALSGGPAFEATGEVYVQNPAPVNAVLQGVFVQISNSRGGQPYVTQASCPVLTIPAGQRVACQWKATPPFNPVGEQVRCRAVPWRGRGGGLEAAALGCSGGGYVPR